MKQKLRAIAMLTVAALGVVTLLIAWKAPAVLTTAKFVKLIVVGIPALFAGFAILMAGDALGDWARMKISGRSAPSQAEELAELGLDAGEVVQEKLRQSQRVDVDIDL